jgi:hypothetical protein
MNDYVGDQDYELIVEAVVDESNFPQTEMELQGRYDKEGYGMYGNSTNYLAEKATIVGKCKTAGSLRFGLPVVGTDLDPAKNHPFLSHASDFVILDYYGNM